VLLLYLLLYSLLYLLHSGGGGAGGGPDIDIMALLAPRSDEEASVVLLYQ